jgi:shikimate kinase
LGSGGPVPPIFLVGYRATGKSSVARIVAERLGVPFADTDSIVEEFTGGLSFAEYFAARGEEAFRDLEQGALRRILDGRLSTGGPVVATGGGIIVRPSNVVAMREVGPVVWLTASVDTIRSRLVADRLTPKSRPPLLYRDPEKPRASALDEVADVLSWREPLYRAAAHAEVSTEGREPSAVAQSVLEFLSSWSPGSPRK